MKDIRGAVKRTARKKDATLIGNANVNAIIIHKWEGSNPIHLLA